MTPCFTASDPTCWISRIDQLIGLLLRWRSHFQEVVKDEEIADHTSIAFALLQNLEGSEFSRLPATITTSKQWLKEIDEAFGLIQEMKVHVVKCYSHIKTQTERMILGEGIKKLPDEILIHIFTLGHGLPFPSTENSTVRHFMMAGKFSTSVSGVSRRFRSLALETSELWTCVYDMMPLHLLNIFLGRCKGRTIYTLLSQTIGGVSPLERYSKFVSFLAGYPVIFAVDVRTVRTISGFLSNLSSHIPLLRGLVLFGRTHGDSFTTTIDITSPLKLPHLQVIRCLDIDLTVLCPVLWNLNEIVLEGCSANSVLSLLSAAASGAQIKSATFRRIEQPKGALLDLHRSGPTVVQGLTSLSLSSHVFDHTSFRVQEEIEYFWTIILPSLVLPDLKTLKIDYLGSVADDKSTIITRFITSLTAENLPKLETVEVINTGLSVSQTLFEFSKFKCLRYLSLGSFRYDPNQEDLLAGVRLYPRLRRLTIAQSNFEEDNVRHFAHILRSSPYWEELETVLLADTRKQLQKAWIQSEFGGKLKISFQ